MYIKIKEAREIIGLSQQQLADMLGISFATLSGYELGKHDPKSETLIQIAKICGVTVDWLLGHKVQSAKDELLLTEFHNLNNEGQDAVLEFVGVCGQMSKYQKKEERKLG